MDSLLYDINILAQPTETTCGPTCLQSLYGHLGLNVSLEEIVDSVKYTKNGGTLGVLLAQEAQTRGLQGVIYTHNLIVFDPSWFSLGKKALAEKLLLQVESGKEEKVRDASKHYADFLLQGGDVRFEPLSPEFIYKTLKTYGPVICGLSATYIYMSKRELGDSCQYDDLHGEPQGHFVVLKGISGDLQMVTLADPMASNPLAHQSEYQVSTQHFINSLLIGVITYDANFIALYNTKDHP